MKDYIPKRGIQLDASFSEHRRNCERCDSAPVAISAQALSKLCLEGSVLWKQENVAAPKRAVQHVQELQQGGLLGESKRLSRAGAKKAMRYK